MKQITIGICDDEAYFAEELYALVYTCGNEYKLDFVINTYLDAEELVTQIESKEKEYDILFLDVEMPKITGLDATRRLRATGYDGIVCFVTSHEQYALESYNLDGWGYLVKPAQYEDVKKLIKKAVIQISYRFNAEEAGKKYLEVCIQKENMTINMDQIVYIEKRRNQSVFHLDDGELVCYESLKSIFPRLNQTQFCFTHQGFIVNFDKVKEVRQGVLILGEGREIPVSRKYYMELKERKKKEIYQSKDDVVS